MLKLAPTNGAGAARRSGARTRRPAAPATAAGSAPATEPPGRGAAAIALLQSSSLPMLVHKELERMIVAGDLPAGGKLNEAAIADLLGVSRGPVREAFRALEESGLVRLEKNRGVFVRQIGVEEADQIYELRSVLDEFAGRRVAQAVTPEIVRELRSRIGRMEQAAAKSDIDAYHRANLEFHDRLVELAGNAKLLHTYRRLVNELNLFRRTALAQAGTLPVSTREHREIVNRIAAGQAAAAGRALQEHVLASRDRMHRTRAGGAKPATTAESGATAASARKTR
jgi:phosphonate utilization transcriptional regulator